MAKAFFFPILMALMVLMIIMVGKRTMEGYVNWDFMDLPNWCAQQRRCSSCGKEEEDAEEDMIPRFGGIPNQSQVWGLGQSGGCGCSKFFH